MSPATLATAFVALLMACVGLAMQPGKASAAFVPLGSFSGPGSGPDQMTEPRGADLRLADGRLFVADRENQRVQVFAPTAAGGQHEASIADPSVSEPRDVAIDQDTGALYVAANSSIFRFDASGNLDATFVPIPITGDIAFDQDADQLLVADRDTTTMTTTIRRFSTAGVELGSFDGSNGGSAFRHVLDLAVDSTGDVLLVEGDGTQGDLVEAGSTSSVKRYSTAGAFESNVGPVTQPTNVAIEPGTDRVVVGGNITGSYNGQPLRVSTFSAAGQAGETIDLPAAPPLLYSQIVAVAVSAQGAGGRLYVVTDVDPASGDGFDYGTVSVQAYDNPEPAAIVGDPAVVGVTGTTADVTASVDPNGYPAAWQFQLSGDGGDTWSLAAEGETEAAGDPVDVSAQLDELEPRSDYLVRLRLPDTGATSGAVPFTTVGAPPRAVTLPAAQVTRTSARLVGSVDPQADETVYWFEYGTTADYGSRVPATGGVSVGDGNRFQAALQDVSGLTPDTTYHYRVVAANGEGTTAGEDRTFTTGEPVTPVDPCPNAAIREAQRAGHLADCRAYEQVSARQKYNGGVSFGHVVADDGEAAGFMMNTPLQEGDGGFPAESYAAWRGPDGWTSRSTALPMRSENRGTGGIVSLAVAYSDDFKQAWLKTNDPVDPGDADPRANGGGLTGAWDIYRTFIDSREYLWESRPEVGATPLPAGGAIGTIAGRSDDGRHVFFQGRRLAAGDPTTVTAVLLYESVEGAIRPVSVLPNGTRVAGNAASGSFNVIGARDDSAISSDGSRVYWSSLVGGVLYLREDGETVAVSRSRRAADLDTERRATFMGASDDGSVAYFHSTFALTEDSTGAGLYRYDANADSLEYLAAVSAVVAGDAQYAPRISDDGSRVYFMANGQFTPEAPPGRNLYLWDGELEHVAGVSASTVNLDRRLRVSADGRYAAFSTTTTLDPRHSSGVTAIYRYDAETGEVACASCPATGSTTQHAYFRAPYARFTIVYAADIAMPRNVADDGSVFFQTEDALDSRDVNRRFDVYQFDGERVNLISSGKGSMGSDVADNSDDGRSIFFVTADSLAGSDIDEGFPDMYVARVDGGFADPTPPAGPCSGDGCQGLGTGVPARSPQGTRTLAGAGNVDPPARPRASLRAPRAAKARGRAVAIRVRVSGAGRITVRGARVRDMAVRVRKAGGRRVVIRLGAQARRTLDRRGRLSTRVRVGFRSASGATAQRTVRITFLRSGR